MQFISKIGVIGSYDYYSMNVCIVQLYTILLVSLIVGQCSKITRFNEACKRKMREKQDHVYSQVVFRTIQMYPIILQPFCISCFLLITFSFHSLTHFCSLERSICKSTKVICYILLWFHGYFAIDYLIDYRYFRSSLSCYLLFIEN